MAKDSSKPDRDAKKPFTPSELKNIELAISHLHEFKEGYVHIERMRAAGAIANNPGLERFFEMSLVAWIDGMYPASREQGVMPVLRLVGCNTLANQIEAALDAPIGNSTFAKIQNVIRDNVFAHPRFSASAYRPFVNNYYDHLAKVEDIRRFGESSATIRESTAAAYVWFARSYPEITAHGIAPAKPPSENPFSSTKGPRPD